MEYARVTHILQTMTSSEKLKKWKQNHKDHKSISGKAAILGTMMHHRILDEISDVPLEVPDVDYEKLPEDAGEILDARVASFKSLGLEFTGTQLVEYTMFHDPDPRFAGTTDCIGKIDGTKSIMDLKSTSQPIKKHELQLGAYFAMAELAGIKDIEQGMLVYVRNDNAEIALIERPELIERKNRFIELATNYHLHLHYPDQ